MPVTPEAEPPSGDPPASRLISRELLRVDEESGVTYIRYVASPEFTNRHGTVQGGFLAAMLDSATAFTQLQTLSSQETAVTTRLTVDFLKPARPGELVASVRVLHRDERAATLEAELADPDGVKVATATAVLRVLRRRPG